MHPDLLGHFPRPAMTTDLDHRFPIRRALDHPSRVRLLRDERRVAKIPIRDFGDDPSLFVDVGLATMAKNEDDEIVFDRHPLQGANDRPDVEGDVAAVRQVNQEVKVVDEYASSLMLQAGFDDAVLEPE